MSILTLTARPLKTWPPYPGIHRAGAFCVPPILSGYRQEVDLPDPCEIGLASAYAEQDHPHRQK